MAHDGSATPRPVVPRFTAQHLRRWGQSRVLEAARGDIDALNVFPVPDGDTGTNLALTWQAGREALDAAAQQESLGSLGVAWARGTLMGARGNSGVITAQLVQGFTSTVGAAPDPDAAAFAAALDVAATQAYAAVMRPVEGTILSVARAAAQAAGERVTEGAADVAAVAAAAAEAAGAALLRTPDQLDVLARAGVLDAGGQGLVLVLDALRKAVDPSAPDEMAVLARWGLGQGAGHLVHPPGGPADSGDGAFEVMYLLEAEDETVPALRSRLDELGASVVVVGGNGLWNVHVHTDDAGSAIEVGVAHGVVSRIRITSLGGGPTASRPGVGRMERVVVAVAPGHRLAALFESVGARVVRGGAGDRPSPGQLVTAAAGAAEVLLLPNDDDHRAVAEAAAAELRDGGVSVAVIPAHAAVQGLAALAVHEPSAPFPDDVAAMSSAAGATRHGAVSRADRAAITSAGICAPGDVLGLVEDDIVVLGTDPAAVASAVVDRMLSAGGELVTLVCGDDPWPGLPLADAVRQHLHRTRLDVEVVVYEGGQSHYPLLVGVE